MATKKKTFRPATKYEAKLRIAITGPSGSGKTLTSLILGTRLVKEYGGNLALIDTERGSASKYADLFTFDTLELESFHPNEYIDAIKTAEQAGYKVLIIDSLSHAWAGKDGALELVDRAAAADKNANSFAAWRNVTPLHQRLMDSIMGSSIHIIATMRSKMGYVQTQDERGRTVIMKVGMQSIQREGTEYEFDIVGDMDLEHNLLISKSRYPALMGQLIQNPNEDLATDIIEWLKGVTPTPQEEKSAPLTNGQSVTREELSNLNKLRETLDVSKDELGNEVKKRFGHSNATQLTAEQIIELRSWMSQQAAKAAHNDPDNYPPEQQELIGAIHKAGWRLEEWESEYLGMSLQDWVKEGHTLEEALMFIPEKKE